MAHGDHLKYSGKPKAGKKTFLRLISYVACDRRLLIVIGVLIVISIAANLTGSYCFARLSTTTSCRATFRDWCASCCSWQLST